MRKALIFAVSDCVPVCMYLSCYYCAHTPLVNGGVHYMTVVALLPDYWLDTYHYPRVHERVMRERPGAVEMK